VRPMVFSAGAFSLSFLLLAAPPVIAQAPPTPPRQREAPPPPRSGTAQDFAIWLRQLTGIGNNHHRRGASSLPLPRPRPVELAPGTMESSKAPAELSPAPIEQSEAPAQPAPASDDSEKETTSAPLND
jgi:hypothetical protein